MTENNNRRDILPNIENIRQQPEKIEQVVHSGSLTDQQILSAAIRPLFTEGSYRSFEAEKDRKEQEATGKGRNFLQNSSRWLTSTVGKTIQESYMGLAHMTSSAINAAGEKVGVTGLGADNMGALMKVSEDIFSNQEKFETDEQIKEALHQKIYNLIVPNEKMGLLTGEAAQLAIALSEFGPFNKNTGQVLEALKKQDGKNKYSTKIEFVLDKLCEKIKLARFNKAAISGAEESMEGEVLSGIINIQDKLKSSGTTGVREKFNVARFAAGLGLGSMKTTVNLVKTAAGTNLGENKRFEFILNDTLQSQEFLEARDQVIGKVEAGKITSDNAELLLAKISNKIAYNTYLQVVKEAMKTNQITTANLTMGGIKGFVNNAVDQGFAVSDIKALAGEGINEPEVQAIILKHNEEMKNFDLQKLGESALELFNSVKKVSIIASENTLEFAAKLRKQQTEITDNAAVVTGKLVLETIKQARDCVPGLIGSTPLVVGAGLLTYNVTGGNMSFGGNKADFNSGLFQENNLVQSRFDRALGLQGGDMTTGEQTWNAGMNLFARANGTGNVYNALLMPLNLIDNATGGHGSRAVGATVSEIQNISTRVGRSVVDYSHSAVDSLGKTWNNNFGNSGVDADATENTLPQPTKPAGNQDSLIAQAGRAVAETGAIDFSTKKAGDSLNYSVVSGGTKLDIPTTYLGTTEGTTALRIEEKNLPKGYRLTEGNSIKGNLFPVILNEKGEPVTEIRTAFLLDAKTRLPAVDANGRNIAVIVEGTGKEGKINGSQISNGFSSLPPSEIAKSRSEGRLIIENNNKPGTNPSVLPETKPNLGTASTFVNPALNNSLLNGNAAIETKPGTNSSALDRLRQATAVPLQQIQATFQTNPAEAAVANSATASAGGLKINVSNPSNSFNIYNNADLAATLGNGEFNSGLSRQVLQEVVRQSNLADLQSKGTVQRLAYLAENKLPIPPELKGLTLSSGAKADAVYEGFVQNPDQAKNALAGTSSNANVATDIKTEYTGKFMVMPVPGGIMASAERTWNELVQTITISSISTTSGDPVIALPKNSQDTTSDTGVKVENGIITAKMGIDFKPLSKISLNMGNGINAVVDATQFPKLMDQLNSGKEIRLSDLLRNVATVNPEVARAIGAIDTNKTVSEGVLNIKGKDGVEVNLFSAIYNTRGLFNVVTDASGNIINSNNINSATQDNNILGPALKTLMNASSDQKIAFLKGIKEYNGKFLSPDEIATLGSEERAKWTLNRLFEKRSPGILNQNLITNEDLSKLASGLNFSGTKVLESNLKEDMLKAFKHNTTLHPNTVPAQILLNINNEKNTLAETIRHIEEAEKYVRGQNRDRMPSGWKPFLKDDISSKLRDISIVQQAMGEKPADIAKDHTYEGTIGLGGLGYKEKAFYNLYNLNYLPKEAAQNFFKGNEEHPQVTSVAQRAYSNIMGIGIDGVRTGPLVNKLAVSILSQLSPLSFAFSMEERTTNKQSFSNLSQQDLANAETVTALAIKFTDPEYAKAYAKYISERNTPEESLILALGAKTDTSTGKWYIEGRNGFKQTFNSIDELNKFSKMARSSVIQVTGEESLNASSSSGVKVFENNPATTVELGGSTLNSKESEELKQYLGNEAKNYEDNMVKARKMLLDAQSNREVMASRLASSFTADSLRQAMGLGTNGFLATHGEFKGGNKDGVMSSTDSATGVKANMDDVNRYKSELDEYKAGKRSVLPDPVLAYLIKCKNFTPLFGQDIPLTTSGEIGTSGKTETDLNIQRNTKVGAEDVAMAAKPPKTQEEPKKPTQEKKKDEELTTENNVTSGKPSTSPGGVKPGPQQDVNNGGINRGNPSADAPATKNFQVTNGTTAQNNINTPAPSVQAPPQPNMPAPAPQVAPDPLIPAPAVQPAAPNIPQPTLDTPPIPVVPAPAVLPQPPVIEVPVVPEVPVPLELAPIQAPDISKIIPENPLQN